MVGLPKTRLVIAALAVGLGCLPAAAAWGQSGIATASVLARGTGPLLERERRAFLDVPAAVPLVVRAVAAAASKRFPPPPQEAEWLAQAAAAGYSAAVFDRVVEGARPPAAPEIAVTTALSRLDQLAGSARPGVGGTRPPPSATTLARALPATLGAREQGLAMRRLFLLCDSTRLSVRSLRIGSAQSAEAAIPYLLNSSRAQTGLDPATGGFEERAVAGAVARTAGGLARLSAQDRAVLTRWVSSPAGREWAAWHAVMLARAYDAAAARTISAYYALIRVHSEWNPPADREVSRGGQGR